MTADLTHLCIQQHMAQLNHEECNRPAQTNEPEQEPPTKKEKRATGVGVQDCTNIDTREGSPGLRLTPKKTCTPQINQNTSGLETRAVSKWPARNQM